MFSSSWNTFVFCVFLIQFCQVYSLISGNPSTQHCPQPPNKRQKQRLAQQAELYLILCPTLGSKINSIYDHLAVIDWNPCSKSLIKAYGKNALHGLAKRSFDISSSGHKLKLTKKSNFCPSSLKYMFIFKRVVWKW